MPHSHVVADKIFDLYVTLCLLCSVQSKIRDLDYVKHNLLSQIDLAYTMEIMQIRPVSTFCC